jgi:hypothetical protein
MRGTISRIVLVINLNNISYYLLLTWLPAFLANARYWCEESGCDWDPSAAAAAGGGSRAVAASSLCFNTSAVVSSPAVAPPPPPLLCEWVTRPVENAYALNTLLMVWVLSFEMVGGVMSDRLGGPDIAVKGGAMALALASVPVFAGVYPLISAWSYVVGTLLLGSVLGIYIGELAVRILPAYLPALCLTVNALRCCCWLVG